MGPIWTCILTVFIIIIVKLTLLKNHQARIFGVYILANNRYYLKYAFIVTLLTLRQLVTKFFPKKNLGPGYGARSHDDPSEMDKRQPLSKDPKNVQNMCCDTRWLWSTHRKVIVSKTKELTAFQSIHEAFDAVYINGANRIGWHLIAGLALRPHNVDGFLILQVPGVGLLLSPKLPDTVLEEQKGDFSSEGLSMRPQKPMRRWHLQYDGDMRFADNRDKRRVHVTIDAKWKSLYHYFNYDTDIPMKNIARAISAEPWSRNYFKCIREYHQTHYEQFGELTGIATIDGVEFNLNMSAMRDHSFGERREWKILHRYVVHMFTLADKTCGNVGIVCIPNMFSRLEFGYVYDKDGSLSAAGDIDFELYQHGEGGTPPTDYGFCFTAGKKRYEVKVKVEKCTEIFLGLEWEARLVESLGRFTVNGVEGWGAVEWMYSHAGGRTASVTHK